MPSLPIQYPLINGMRHDFSSMEVGPAGKFFNGFKSVSYSQTLEPGKVRGNRAQITGRTRGVLDCEASVEVYLSELEVFLDLIMAAGAGRGIYEVSFPLIISYAEALQRPIVDTIFGCRIKTIGLDSSEGGDAITKKIDLDPMWISFNGRDPLGVGQMLK